MDLKVESQKILEFSNLSKHLLLKLLQKMREK